MKFKNLKLYLTYSTHIKAVIIYMWTSNKLMWFTTWSVVELASLLCIFLWKNKNKILIHYFNTASISPLWTEGLVRLNMSLKAQTREWGSDGAKAYMQLMVWDDKKQKNKKATTKIPSKTINTLYKTLFHINILKYY